MFEAVIYFAGPKTVWTGKLADEDVIFRRSLPWRWMARWLARSTHSSLDPHRCGWCVMQGDSIIDHVEPDLIQPPAPPTLNEQVAEAQAMRNAERARENVLRRFRQRNLH